MGKTLGKLLEEKLGQRFENLYDYHVISPMSLDDDCHIHVIVQQGTEKDARENKLHTSEYFIDFDQAEVRTKAKKSTHPDSRDQSQKGGRG